MSRGWRRTCWMKRVDQQQRSPAPDYGNRYASAEVPMVAYGISSIVRPHELASSQNSPKLATQMLPFVRRCLWRSAARTVLVTTLNAEYNALFQISRQAVSGIATTDSNGPAEFAAGRKDRRGLRLPCGIQRYRHERQNRRIAPDGRLHAINSCAMNVEIPDFSLVVLIGSTGSGKSTFAAKHFLPTEVISSDYCRGLVADDETDQSISVDAFDLVREIAGKRLKHRKLAVIDATNVRAAERLGRTGPQMARFASRYCIRPRHRHLHCAQ